MRLRIRAPYSPRNFQEIRGSLRIFGILLNDLILRLAKSKGNFGLGLVLGLLPLPLLRSRKGSSLVFPADSCKIQEEYL